MFEKSPTSGTPASKAEIVPGPGKITYTAIGDRVTVEMSRDDYSTLSLVLGYAAGAANMAGNTERFREWVRFANRLNATNPNFRQYEIP